MKEYIVRWMGLVQSDFMFRPPIPKLRYRCFNNLVEAEIFIIKIDTYMMSKNMDCSFNTIIY